MFHYSRLFILVISLVIFDILLNLFLCFWCIIASLGVFKSIIY